MKSNIELYALAAAGGIGGVYKYYKPELAWAAIGVGVAAYDLSCERGQTLSETFRKQPLALQVGELALVGAHLLDLLPDKVDPFTQIIDLVKR